MELHFSFLAIFLSVVMLVKSQNMPVFIGSNTPAVRPNFGTNNQFGGPIGPPRGPPRGPPQGPQFSGPGPTRSRQFAGPVGTFVPQIPGPGVGRAPQFTPNGGAGPRFRRQPGGVMSPFPGPGPNNGRPMPVGPSGPVGAAAMSGPMSRQQQQMRRQQQEQSRWAPGEPTWVFPSSPREWMNSCQRTGCSAMGTQCVFWGGLCPTSVRRTPCTCERGCKVDDVFIPFGQSKVMDGCNNVCACYSREGLASCTARRC